MGRQLFLHHYLPAHLASALVTGALVEFVFNLDPVIQDEPSYAARVESKSGKKNDKMVANVKDQPASSNFSGNSMLGLWAAIGAILAVVVFGWYFFLPLTYGKPGLDVDQVNARKWMNYDLHFAK